jgi:hypothetical protein
MVSTLETNKELVRRYTREVFDEGDIAAVDRYLASDFYNHVTGKTGTDDFKHLARDVGQAAGTRNVLIGFAQTIPFAFVYSRGRTQDRRDRKRDRDDCPQARLWRGAITGASCSANCRRRGRSDDGRRRQRSSGHRGSCRVR